MTEKKQPIKKKSKNFFLWSKYFMMKWRFRLTQIQGIFSLITYAAMLAASYIKYITVFEKMGFWGVILFAGLIFLAFAIGGFLYDKTFKLWSETNIVNVERNPYTWVPGPKDEIQWLGWFAFIFNSLNQIANKLDVELEGEEIIKEHMAEFFKLNPKTPNFEQEAKRIQKLSRQLEKTFLEKGKNDTFIEDKEE
ncbi:MAG: hypothetical protein ACFFDW_17185 [Candidatus Thorarchaeota archaeon]